MEYIYNCILDDTLYSRHYTVELRETTGIAKEKVYSRTAPFRTYRWIKRGSITPVRTDTVLPLLLSPTVAIVHWSQIENIALPSECNGIAYYGIDGYAENEVNSVQFHYSETEDPYRSGLADSKTDPDDSYGDIAVTRQTTYYLLPIGWTEMVRLPYRLSSDEIIALHDARAKAK